MARKKMNVKKDGKYRVRARIAEKERWRGEHEEKKRGR